MIIIMFLEKWQLYYQCLRPTVCRAVKTKTSSSFLLVIRQPGPPPSGKHLNQYEEAAEPYLTRGRKTLAARRLEEGETFPRSETSARHSSYLLLCIVRGEMREAIFCQFPFNYHFFCVHSIKAGISVWAAHCVRLITLNVCPLATRELNAKSLHLRECV